MKKNILPIILIAGAALAFMAFRKRRPKVSVTAESPEIQTGAEYQADYAATVKPTPIEVGTKLVQTLFPKKTAAQKAQAAAVKKAVAKGITKKKAKAVTKALQRPAFVRGISDDKVLC
mgnify:CR=1 FL=1